MTLNDWREVIEILQRNGCTELFAGIEHDTIYLDVTTSKIPETTRDGQRLTVLGFMIENGYWTIRRTNM